MGPAGFAGLLESWHGFLTPGMGHAGDARGRFCTDARRLPATTKGSSSTTTSHDARSIQ